MSNLINQNWIGLDGKPVTGRVPPTIRMMAGAMTPALMAEVAHRYQLFCLNKQAAVGDYFVSDRVLPDGSRVRIISNMGVDVVMVWSKYGPPVAELYHGLAVFADWMAMPLHRRKADGAIKFAGRAVQIGSPDTTYGHCTITPDGEGPDKRIFYPMVNGGAKELWGLWKHKGNEGGKNGTIPLLLKYAGGKGQFAFMKERKLIAADGQELYVMPDVPPRNPGETSTPQTLPPCVTGDGKQIAFIQRRTAMISPTFNRQNILYGHQLMKLKDGQFVPEGAMQSHNFTAPIGEATDIIEGGDVGIDEAVSASPKTTTLVVLPDAFGWSFNQDGMSTPFIPWTSSGHEWITFDEVREVVKGGYFSRNDGTSESTPISDFIPVPSLDLMNSCRLINRLNYPVKGMWQGGMRVVELDADVYTGYGLVSKGRTKRTTEWEIDAEPSLALSIDGIPDVKVLEGTVFGQITGHRHETTEGRVNKYMDTGWNLSDNGAFMRPFPNNTLGLKTTLAFPPDFGGDSNAARAWVVANAIDFYAIAASNPHETTVAEDLEAPKVIGHYSYTSRYVVDFDSRLGLMVAIKVTVQCAGASWSQKPDSYLGNLVLDADPNYTVTIALDWRVAGATGDFVEGSKVLHESSFTKPPNEFEYTLMPNVLYWPMPESEFRQLWMAMPPKLSPQPEFYEQLDNLTKHQHVSSHFAGCDIVAAGEKAAESGYEPSTLNGTLIAPHKRKPVGTLYARTIQPDQFYGALWLLRELKVDSMELGKSLESVPPPAPYFYAPEVGKAIGEKYRLELTEDGEVNWTDLVPAKAGVAKPKLIDRDIKTFYV